MPRARVPGQLQLASPFLLPSALALLQVARGEHGREARRREAEGEAADLRQQARHSPLDPRHPTHHVAFEAVARERAPSAL